MTKAQLPEAMTLAQADAGAGCWADIDQEWEDDRLRKPNALVRILGWLVRPVVWEAMRQHPVIDYDREDNAPTLTLQDPRVWKLGYFYGIDCRGRSPAMYVGFEQNGPQSPGSQQQRWT